MIYLGLGSNQGERRSFLSAAIEQLKAAGVEIRQISPVVESPALLGKEAEPNWNRPYLNLVLACEASFSPAEMLKRAKQIEQALGRDLQAPRWSPRNIDIDLLLWHDERISTPELTIPHPEMYKRSFVITPLMHLAPHLPVPGINLTPLQISQQIRPIPLWMGVLNLTPDSFSDGGSIRDTAMLESRLDQWIAEGVHILDLGGESTRPNADTVSESEEQRRLQPVFELLGEMRHRHALMPLISVDTRNTKVARWALESGADWINDVSGLRAPPMLAAVKESAAQAVAMHSLSVPVVPGEALDTARPVEVQLREWLQARQADWQAAGIDPGNILFDPGVGFGKTALQNMDIIRRTASLRGLGYRLLVGHSRKSFMNSFAVDEFAQRDMETLGLSLAMCEQGVDVIRVHDPLSHIRAYRAWSQARA